MTSTSISTPIPSGTSPAKVLAALKDHDLMIKTLCPELISYEFVSGDTKGEAVYSVTDKKPIGKTTYKLTLTTVENGVNSLVNAKPPVGTLTISGKWRVEGNTLKEDVDIDANIVMKKMVKGNVEKSHPIQHGKLLEQVAGA